MEIKVNTGLVDYDLGGKVTVSFNPTDAAFGKAISDAIERIIALHDAPLPEESDALLGEILRRDEEARGIIDNIFGKEVCAPLFGTISVFAIADGFPLWTNLLMAFVDQMNEAGAKAAADIQKRINKYTKKYVK